jgi:hypothetical protein
MHCRIRAVCLTGTAVCLLSVWPPVDASAGQARDGGRGRVDITAGSVAQRRAWTSRVDGMLRSGDLRIRQTREDTLLPGRTHERANQYHRGVRVFGGDIARQLRNGRRRSTRMARGPSWRHGSGSRLTIGGRPN